MLILLCTLHLLKNIRITITMTATCQAIKIISYIVMVLYSLLLIIYNATHKKILYSRTLNLHAAFGNGQLMLSGA